MRKLFLSLRTKKIFSYAVGAAFVGLLVSFCYGPDTFWDNLNYYAYVPYSWLHGRIGWDIAPAGIHSYFNSISATIYYFLFQVWADYPLLLLVYQSVWVSAGLFFSLLLLRDCLPLKKQNIPAWMLGFLFIFAPAIHTFGPLNTGDMQSAALFVGSLWFFFRFLRKQDQFSFYVAAVLYGASFAFKYTMFPFLIGYIVLFFASFSSFKQTLRWGLCFALVSSIVFLLLNGAWLWKMYSFSGNPFFPFYNNIFHSPLFDSVALVDNRFFANKSVLEIIFAPIFFLFSKPMTLHESAIHSASLLAYWASAIFLLFRLRKGTLHKGINATYTKLLIILWIVSYILWAYSFLLLRYAMTLEIIGSLLVVIALWEGVRGKNRFLYMGILCGIICFSGRMFQARFDIPPTLRPLSEKEQQYLAEKILPDSVVIVPGNRLSFVIPYLPKDARYVGSLPLDLQDYPSLSTRLLAAHEWNFSPLFFRHHFKGPIHRAIQESSNVYVLFNQEKQYLFQSFPLTPYGVRVKKGTCYRFGNVIYDSFFLCEAEKL